MVQIDLIDSVNETIATGRLGRRGFRRDGAVTVVVWDGQSWEIDDTATRKAVGTGILEPNHLAIFAERADVEAILVDFDPPPGDIVLVADETIADTFEALLNRVEEEGGNVTVDLHLSRLFITRAGSRLTFTNMRRLDR